MDEEMITAGKWENFLNLDGERLLLVKRKHPFVIIFPILILFLLTAIFISGSYLLFTDFISSPLLFLTSLLLLVSLLLTFVTKCIMDWYFHLYILTTRKILEVWYTPLYSHVMNDVLLDRVSCTEIDFRRSGIFNELFDIGDIVLTFDRPTHQESFIIKDMQACYKLGRFLTRKLLDHGNQSNFQTIWFKQRENISTY